MLKCPLCQVEISTRTEVCPLCHTPLPDASIESEDYKKTELAYPKRGKLAPFSGNIFDKVYLGCWLILSIVALLTELIVTKSLRYSWIGVAFTFYFYIIFRITLRGHGAHFPARITFHAVILSAVVCSLNAAIPESLIIFEFVLPSVYLASLIAISVFLAINYKSPNQYLLNIIFIGLLSALPFLIVIITDKPSNPIMAAVTLAIGIVAIIVVIIFKARQVYAELKRKFHI